MEQYYIGFDIGGTKCAVSLGRWVNQQIEILDRHEIQHETAQIKLSMHWRLS